MTNFTSCNCIDIYINIEKLVHYYIITFVIFFCVTIMTIITYYNIIQYISFHREYRWLS